ncbi:hypothetical protein [Desulforamulus aquiferis]|uniref:Uncharacterized protein n=1 Tax=Desulforamulus aquiferis TaxID=1397668 RepID=A0AAW7Z7Y9_9FIRM|nr:hypothetical protein [Desulforamulus aquiferis]MDO7785656.1 hypothetical protein [Desulforamulus aquiferis]RYD03248.1 hypothetical protein N752_20670 [Desulforamulus aquiferis]
MFSPDIDPAILKRYLPTMSKEDLEDMLKKVEECLRYETNGQKLMRIMDNQTILEKAIDTYYNC